MKAAAEDANAQCGSIDSRRGHLCHISRLGANVLEISTCLRSGSRSASPTASLLRGHGHADTQNDLLGETVPTSNGAWHMSIHLSTHMSVHMCTATPATSLFIEPLPHLGLGTDILELLLRREMEIILCKLVNEYEVAVVQSPAQQHSYGPYSYGRSCCDAVPCPTT